MRIIAYIFIAIALTATALLLFGPREPVEGEITFAEADLGDDLDAYLAGERDPY